MRVLVVLTHPPLEEGSPAGRCAIALIRGLRAHGVDLTAVAANIGMEALAPLPEDLGVEVVGVDTAPSWRLRAARYADPGSALARGEFPARVRALADGADVVYLDEILAAAAGRALPVRTVTHLHCLARRDRPLARPWTPEARDGLELIRAERRVARRSKHLVANSPEVAQQLCAQGARDVTVMPLALDPAAYGRAALAEPPIAGLIGSAGWPPTANAVHRLLSRVWPRVLRRRPDAIFRIAGRGMTRETFPELPSPPGVQWVGPVDSAESFLRSLGLLLYPLDRGSGTKVKVLEAMALGLPVVTTPPGAEGVTPGRGVVVEQDDDRLASITVELLDDPAARRERGAAARDTFGLYHTPLPATAPLAWLFERIAEIGGVGPGDGPALSRRPPSGAPRSAPR